MLYLGPLPPCSRVTISAKAVEHSLSAGIRVDDYSIAGMSFVDVYGQRWARLASGPLQPMKEAPAKGNDGFGENAKSIQKALFGKNEARGMWMAIPGAGNSELAAPKPLEDCGTDK